jgi:cytochrome c-type biogenesis protein CcsB
MENTVDVGFFWIAFWLYLASFLIFTVYSALGRKRMGVAATVVFLAAFALHTIGVVARWWITAHPPFSTMYEYALSTGWMVAFFFLFVVVKYRRISIGVIVSPMLVIVMVIASLLPKRASMQLMPALQSYWFYIHVTLAALSEGAFILAAGAGILYLFGKPGKRGALPGRDFLEELISRSIRVGYPLFTVGALFAGAIWAQKAWGSFWSWDPKETGSLVIWLFYTLVLHQDVRGRWRGRGLAVMSIIGLAIIIVSFLGNLFLGGLHAYI